ncbi:hypothetical protein TUM19329_27300 [Legionella antarctica]|uniref:Mevalonate kinase n=1 Tax=Legionella antarctica TaxID=2708020 RepID=A0A6F8T7D5_9GAMM|nr:hypothetical protein [Legionella antarctica]BCA96369.1 hypothetical protein TUM19329_27300 [Legionella antarctica]
MKWRIPAKTFLLGEYVAVTEASAIILTTTPYFELLLTDRKELVGIHSDSPAGIWWQRQKYSSKGLSWYDPYNGLGGLGASSAQFLASYLASSYIENKISDLNSMLQAYYQSSWSGAGLRPSGYDVIAQSQQGCVYINKQKKIIQSYDWPFKDLSFLLLHTGVKLATHHHLQSASLPHQLEELSLTVDEAKQAFEEINSKKLLDSINNYHHQLSELNLVALHSLELINRLRTFPEVLAIKGCGAMGADVLLVLTSGHNARSLSYKLKSQNWAILATEKNLTTSTQNPNMDGRL